MPSVIPSLAILKVNWDANSDYIESFVPFAAEALRTADRPEVTLAEVQAGIRDGFGLTIPNGALETILKRLIKRGYARRREGAYIRDEQKLAELDIAGASRAALRQHEALILRLVEFADGEFGLEWSNDEAEASLHGYLEISGSAVLGALVDGRVLESSGAGTDSSYVVGRFVAEAIESDPETLEYIETTVKGAMLAGALLASGLGEVQRSFDGVSFYFDTRFLLQTLGLEGDEARHPRIELLELLYKKGAHLRVFQNTLDELYGVLSAASNALSRPEALRLARGRTIRYLADARWTRSDVDSLASGLERSLEAQRIHVSDRPRFDEESVIDERELGRRLEDAYSPSARTAVRHDVDVVAAIQHLRSGRIPDKLESSKAVFVTTNMAMVNVSRRFFFEEYHPTGNRWVPPVLAEGLLTTLAWLKTAQAAPDLPRKRVIADCYAALNPPDHIWTRYLVEIDRLEASGEVTEDDYNLLRYDVAARNALMDETLGGVRELTRDTINDVLRRAHETARSELAADLRAERAARQAAEREVADMTAATVLERQARADRNSAIAARIGSTAGGALVGLAALVIIVAMVASWHLGSLPGSPLLVGPLVGAVILASALLFLNAMWGLSAASLARRADIQVTAVVEGFLMRAFPP